MAKLLKDLLNEYMIVNAQKEALLSEDHEEMINLSTIIYLPKKVDTDLIFKINRKFTYDDGEFYNCKEWKASRLKFHPTIGYVVYPTKKGEWVLQRIHGTPLPTEWYFDMPEGCLEINFGLDFWKKKEADWAIFEDEDSLQEALYFMKNFSYDWCRRPLQPKVKEDFPWEHL